MVQRDGDVKAFTLEDSLHEGVSITTPEAAQAHGIRMHPFHLECMLLNGDLLELAF